MSHRNCSFNLQAFASRCSRLPGRLTFSNFSKILACACSSHLGSRSCQPAFAHYLQPSSCPLKRTAHWQAAQQWPTSGLCCSRSCRVGKKRQPLTCVLSQHRWACAGHLWSALAAAKFPASRIFVDRKYKATQAFSHRDWPKRWDSPSLDGLGPANCWESAPGGALGQLFGCSRPKEHRYSYPQAN